MLIVNNNLYNKQIQFLLNKIKKQRLDLIKAKFDLLNSTILLDKFFLILCKMKKCLDIIRIINYFRSCNKYMFFFRYIKRILIFLNIFCKIKKYLCKS